MLLGAPPPPPRLHRATFLSAFVLRFHSFSSWYIPLQWPLLFVRYDPVIPHSGPSSSVPQVINKNSNEMFRTEDIEMLATIASHIALTLEGEGSSIRKILALCNDQVRKAKGSYDFVRTKTYFLIRGDL